MNAVYMIKIKRNPKRSILDSQRIEILCPTFRDFKPNFQLIHFSRLASKLNECVLCV